MSQIIIEKPYAEIREVGKMFKDVKNDNVLRVYCYLFPDAYYFQIRTFAPIVEGGKPRNMIAHCTVTIEELENILTEMKNYRDGKPSQFDTTPQKDQP